MSNKYLSIDKTGMVFETKKGPFTALQNIVPSHLMDARLYDFQGLQATGVASEDGDKAFDEETFTEPGLPGLQVVSI